MNEVEARFAALYATRLEPKNLIRRGAAGLVSLLSSDRYNGAEFLWAGRHDKTGSEVVVVEAQIALGQRPPINDIRGRERLALYFNSDERLPSVYPLRDDFPTDLPHFNLSVEGEPRSLCLFDIPADEAMRIATPFVLIERARHWLSESAHGRLHGEDQPLDPLFFPSPHAIILPPSRPGRKNQAFTGHRFSDLPKFPIVLEHTDDARTMGQRPKEHSFACMVITTPPLPHGRMRSVPGDLASLTDMFRELGVDIVALLRSIVQAWIGDTATRELLQGRSLIVIRTPIERAPGDIGGEAVKGFMSASSAADVGVAIGALMSASGQLGRALVPVDPDVSAMRAVCLEPVDVYLGFDRSLARAASGVSLDRPVDKVALIGAGAVGSQFALTAAREGHGSWVVIDPDHLMPHNLARHALTPGFVGAPKAEALAHELVGLLGNDAAEWRSIDVRDAAGAASLAAADIIIDASASVPVARWLAARPVPIVRSSSVFMNPRGDNLVVLIESSDGGCRLDHLEMSYYWLLVVRPSLSAHLTDGETILPSGGCRSPSLKIPQSSVAAFAAFAVRSMFGRPLPDGSAIRIWQMTGGGCSHDEVSGDVYKEIEVGGWTVSIRASVLADVRSARETAGDLETGGILVGTWDRVLRKAWIVACLEPPPDSEHAPDGFVRGCVGVYQSLKHIEETTAFNLTYVGEWHTHPPRHSSAPSDDDKVLLRWIADTLVHSDVPPLMLIVGTDGIRVILLDGDGCRHALIQIPAERPS